MKSLEIVNLCLEDLVNNKTEICEYDLLKIKADLEVLEILKKYVYYIDHTIKLKSISKSVYNFNYEKVKQWLEENENDN
jgi:hypothetical protein